MRHAGADAAMAYYNDSKSYVLPTLLFAAERGLYRVRSCVAHCSVGRALTSAQLLALVAPAANMRLPGRETEKDTMRYVS
jgi:hypothetical protein